MIHLARAMRRRGGSWRSLVVVTQDQQCSRKLRDMFSSDARLFAHASELLLLFPRCRVCLVEVLILDLEAISMRALSWCCDAAFSSVTICTICKCFILACYRFAFAAKSTNNRGLMHIPVQQCSSNHDNQRTGSATYNKFLNILFCCPTRQTQYDHVIASKESEIWSRVNIV